MDFGELSDLTQMDDIKTAIGFIRELENASLDDKAMALEPDVLKRLQNPLQEPINITSPDLRLALDLFIAVGNASQVTYNAVCRAILHCYPEDEILSYDQIKHRVTQLSGITPLIHDMCVSHIQAHTVDLTHVQSVVRLSTM